MTKTPIAALAALAMLVAACGQAQSGDRVNAGSADDRAEIGSTVLAPDGDAPAGGENDPGTRDTEVSDETVGSDQAREAATVAESTAGTLRSILLEKTLDESSPVSSARFEGRITMVGSPGSELPGEVSMTFAGAYDLSTDASQLSMDLSGIMGAAAAGAGDELTGMELFADFFNEPMEMISIGDRAWIKWGLISMFSGSDDMWIEGDASDTGAISSGLGFGGGSSPTAILELLADADASVETLGTEELRGTSTTHYRAVIDAEKLSETMSAEDRAEFQAELGTAPIARFPMEIWMDGDGLLHRFVLEFSGPETLESSNGELESIELVFDIWDHGSDLAITPPPADQILTEDDLNFDLGDMADLGG